MFSFQFVRPVAAGFVVWSIAPLGGLIIPRIAWYVKREFRKNQKFFQRRGLRGAPIRPIGAGRSCRKGKFGNGISHY
nr:MAG TPA_asm: hypothetical protein [Caudoviricetes sp.]